MRRRVVLAIVVCFATLSGCSSGSSRTASAQPATTSRASTARSTTPSTAPATKDSEVAAIRKVVSSFYSAFNSNSFDSWAPANTTQDWNHIDPAGGWTPGRENVLAGLRLAHSTFLKGVTNTVEEMSARFATSSVAVVVATSRASTYTTPDGVTHQNDRERRTFVVVKRSGRWLVMQDQNTVVAGP